MNKFILLQVFCATLLCTGCLFFKKSEPVCSASPGRVNEINYNLIDNFSMDCELRKMLGGIINNLYQCTFVLMASKASSTIYEIKHSITAYFDGY